MEEKKLKIELTEEEAAKVTGGTGLDEHDEQILVTCGEKNYAKDLLDNVPPGGAI